MSALVKFFILLALTLGSFFFGPLGLGLGSLIILIGTLGARLTPRFLFSGSGPLLVTSFFILPLKAFRLTQPYFDSEGALQGLLFIASIGVSFAGGALLFATTTSRDLRKTLMNLEKILLSPLVWGLSKNSTPWAKRWVRALNRPRLALSVSLMLSFIPRIFEVWENTELAYRARLGKKGIRGYGTLILLATERLMEAAGETALALESRSFSYMELERAANSRASNSAAVLDE
jgi:energy-coupling factor transporter transmembrane protein EcfT